MSVRLDIVIAGGGRVGFQTAELLVGQDHDVTIVERDGDTCDAIADAYVATVVEGDATNPDILEQADIEGADVVAALTGETGLNLAICMAAKELSPGIRTVARIDRASGEAYTRFVDAVLFPERAGARVAANEIVGSDVRTLADVTGELEILDVQVDYDAPIKDERLADVDFPDGAQVITRTNGHVAARAEETLVGGRRYLVAADTPVVDDVLEMFQGGDQSSKS